VGTSFCENQSPKISGFAAEGIESLNDIKRALSSNSLYFPNFSSASFTNWSDITIDILDEQIKSRKRSAEIDSLRKKELCKNDWVVLLCSMTVDCLYSGLAVRKYLRTKGLCERVDVEVVEGLVDAKKIDFGKVGLPSFLDVLYRYVKEGEQDHYKVVLNATAGYKALVSPMTIVGLILGLEIIYLFEEGEQLVTIPPLPLHVNLPAWSQIESVVELLAGKTDYKGNRIYEDVKDRIEAILIARDGKLKASALVGVFRDYADKERGKPELITRTENSPLLNLLTDEQKRVFERITKIGHLIWKGDRVPEMADHALRHHSDIFHLAERFFLPIFYYKKDFLQPHELFALLCALYLHDCGHVIGGIKKTDGNFLHLLPTEIRDHHHVLGYLRLKHPEERSYLGHLIYDHLGDTKEGDSNKRKKWGNAWDNYLHAVATLGLYHRKKMRLEVVGNYEFFKDYPISVDKDFPCLRGRLKSSPITVFGTEIGKERAALLVALLRIIDSLDEQVSRTGDINDIRFHLAQLEAEAEVQKRQAETLKLALDETVRQKIEEHSKGLEIQYRKDEDKWFLPKAEEKDQAIGARAFREKLESLSKDEATKALAFEYASAYVGHFFKKFQMGPYGEKAYIRGISVNADKVDERVRIKIDLNIEDDPDRLRALSEFAKVRLECGNLNMTQESDQAKYRKGMLKVLKKEYLHNEGSEEEPRRVVKKILKNAGIELQYGEEADHEYSDKG
jgi:putative CRISPR-associated protein (TIGR02619 family)